MHILNRHSIQLLAQGLSQFQAMEEGMLLSAHSSAQFALRFPVLYVTASEVLQPSFGNFTFLHHAWTGTITE